MNGQRLNAGEKYGTFTIIGTEKDSKNKTIYILKCDCGSEKKCIGYYVRKNRKCRSCHANSLIGKKNNKTTFLESLGHSRYKCKCDCGNEFIGRERNKSCGCHIEEDLIKDAEKLVGISDSGLKILKFLNFKYNKKKGTRIASYLAKCKCGKEFEVSRSVINKTKSCGCRSNCKYQKGEEHYNANLTKNESLSIIEMYLTGLYTKKEISNMLNIDTSCVRRILQRKSWKSLEIPKAITKQKNYLKLIGVVRKTEEIIIGQNYGNWKVIEKSQTIKGHARYLCECKCKNTYIVMGSNLRTGKSKCCKKCQKDWCKKYDYEAYVGQKIGSKLILEYLIENKIKKFHFKCDCGHEKVSSALHIIRSKFDWCEKCYKRPKRKKAP